MRNALIAILIVLAAGCASSDPTNENVERAELELLQVIGPAELGYPYGRADLRFELRVANTTGEPITLRRVELMSVGGGAYSLQRDFYNFGNAINPHSTAGVTIWAHAFLRGRTDAEHEPTTLRGIAYFEAPSGNFRRIFVERFAQY